MRLEDQVCSLELAKELKGLGVKQESAFYWMLSNIDGQWKLTDTVFYEKTTMLLIKEQQERIVSAFTVGELGEILKNYESWSFYLRNQWCCNEGGGHLGTWREYASTEADARAKMLIHLIKTGVVKP